MILLGCPAAPGSYSDRDVHSVFYILPIDSTLDKERIE